MRKRVCVDFDRVLHKYERSIGHGYASIVDDPLPGAQQLLAALAEEYTVCIHTTRANTDEGEQAVRRWLDQRQMVYHEVRAKPEAIAYIDDRAISVRRRTWNRIGRLRLLHKVRWLLHHGAGAKPR